MFVAVAIVSVTIAIAWLALRDLRRAALAATAFVAFMVFGREIAKIVANAADLLPGWQLGAFGLAMAAILGLATRVAWRSLRRSDGLSRWPSAR
jgi:hypothetical protein